MNPKSNKFKIDGFHYVIAGAFIFGILSIAFILTTALPKEIKLIRWSDTNDPTYILESLARIQYPVLKDTYSLQIVGLNQINLSSENAIDIISNVLDQKVELYSRKSLEKKDEELFILNPNSKNNIRLQVNLKQMTLKDLDPEKQYDPKALMKLQKKIDGKFLFTAYKTNASQIFLDIIQLQ